MVSTYWFTDQPVGNSTVQATFDIDRQFGEHADVFAEYAGEFPTHGIPMQISNFHAGFGLTRNSPNYFVGIGYSLRLDGLW